MSWYIDKQFARINTGDPKYSVKVSGWSTETNYMNITWETVEAIAELIAQDPYHREDGDKP